MNLEVVVGALGVVVFDFTVVVLCDTGFQVKASTLKAQTVDQVIQLKCFLTSTYVFLLKLFEVLISKFEDRLEKLYRIILFRKIEKSVQKNPAKTIRIFWWIFLDVLGIYILSIT